MTIQHKPRKRTAKEIVPPLTLGALGTAGVIVLYFLIPGFQPIELVLMLVVVGFGAVGCMQNILRGIMTIVILYVATGIAAIFYRAIAPYAGTILGIFILLWQEVVGAATSSQLTTPETALLSGGVTRDSLAFSFALLTGITWGILETISRVSFRDTSMPKLGILDNMGSVLVHLVIGALVASLLFSVIGYGQLRHVHDKALLRPRFNQVLYLHYTAQSLWFPRRPPPIYVYDLDLSR